MSDVSTIPAAGDKFATFAATAATFGDTITTVTGLDDWGPVISDKDALIDCPFIIVKFAFRDGDYGEYVAAEIITSDDEKFVVTDGSAGIYRQLKALAEDGKTGAVFAPKGLRRSDYEMNGRAARTYYLAG